MHNVEVFVNYDPPCNSVSTARRLNKRSSSNDHHQRLALQRRAIPEKLTSTNYIFDELFIFNVALDRCYNLGTHCVLCHYFRNLSEITTSQNQMLCIVFEMLGKLSKSLLAIS